MKAIQPPTTSIKIKPKNLLEIMEVCVNAKALGKSVNNSDSIRKLIVEAARSIHLS